MKNNHGFVGVLPLLVGVLVVVVVGVITVRSATNKRLTTSQNPSPSISPSSSSTPLPKTQPTVSASSPTIKPASAVTPVPVNNASTLFNASQFFDQVQNGMNTKQVEALAGGKQGDCAQTGVWPPSGNVSCTWQDKQTAVTVNFTKDVVVGKGKRSL